MSALVTHVNSSLKVSTTTPTNAQVISKMGHVTQQTGKRQAVHVLTMRKWRVDRVSDLNVTVACCASLTPNSIPLPTITSGMCAAHASTTTKNDKTTTGKQPSVVVRDCVLTHRYQRPMSTRGSCATSTHPPCTSPLCFHQPTSSHF